MTEIFRVFVSSTFRDFQVERRVLQDHVFPELDSYAKSFGARFEAVDLRWGIGAAAQDEHATIDICLSELARAQRVSPRPNFIVLFGERYGWEPAPSRIPEHAWHALMEAADADSAALLRACYRRDRNQLPEATWVLTPRTEWPLTEGPAERASEAQLLGALRSAAMASTLSPRDRAVFFRSATHHEVDAGALATPDAGQHVCAYVRVIEDLATMVNGADFIDVDPDGQRSSGPTARLADLVAEVRKVCDSSNVHDYSVRWSDDADQARYLDQFRTDVLADQKRLMDERLRVKLGDSTPPIDPHVAFARGSSRIVVGRDALLTAVDAYSSQNDTAGRPLFIEGEGGSGKTAVLAASFLRLAEQRSAGVVVPLFAGAVAGSESLRALVTELATTVPLLLGQESIHVGPTIPDLASAFDRIMRLGTRETPLTLIIDGLDELLPADWAHELGWIPHDLPAFCRLIVGIRLGPLSRRARSSFPQAHFEVLNPLSVSDGRAALTALLGERSRTLTAQQERTVLASFARHGLPLWLVIAADICEGIRSYDQPPRLPGTVDGLINRLVSDLCRDAHHGQALVRAALGYIAASQYGLSDEELNTALGNDKKLRSDFETRAGQEGQQWHEDVLPPIIWARLRHDLGRYLTEQEVEGTLATRFFHREFTDLVAERFLRPVGDEDLVAHAGLVYAFRPPRPLDNWFHVQAGGRQDTQTLRSLRQQLWHLSRARMDSPPTSDAAAGSDPPPGDGASELTDHFLTDPRVRIWSHADADLARAVAGIPDAWGHVRTVDEAVFICGWQYWGSDVSWALVRAVLDGFPNLETAKLAWTERQGDSSSLNSLGWVAWDEGEVAEAKRLWIESASRANTDAMVNLGFLTAPDDALAGLHWWEQGAAAGNLQAIVGLAFRLGATQKGMRWMSQAARMGNTDAMISLARTRSDVDAAALLSRAARRGSPEAMWVLGCLADHFGDVSGAREWWLQASGLGDSESARLMGDSYNDAEDPTESITWWTRAAASGNVEALVQLGIVFEQLGYEAEAAAWFLAAAVAGDSGAMVEVGDRLYEVADMTNSLAWWSRAAAQGSPKGQLRLGERALASNAIEVAFSWLSAAARGGCAEAMNILGHYSAEDGRHDDAQRWWLEAAELGFAPAMVRLGIHARETGELAEGREWYLQAAAAGDHDAMLYLSVIAAQAGDSAEERLWLDLIVQSDPGQTLKSLAHLSAVVPGGSKEVQGAASNSGDHAATWRLADHSEESGDTDSAAIWWRRLAQWGDSQAMIKLGQWLASRGQLEESIAWWESAASQRSPIAMLQLGLVTEMEGDAGTSVAWLERASDAGSLDAADHLRRIRQSSS